MRGKLHIRNWFAVGALGLSVLGFASKGSGLINPQDLPKSWQGKEHSKRFESYRTGKKLARLVAESKEEIVEVNMGVLPELAPISRGNLPSYPSPFLRRSACDSDAIVLGSVNNQSSSETENGEFVFTEVRFGVTQLLKDNAIAPIPLNSEITVIRPGGTIQMGSRTVRAVDPFFPQFENHAQYLLFLRYVSETGAYQAYGISSYVLKGKKVFLLTVRPALGKRNFQAEDLSRFMDEVKEAIIASCSEMSR
ncbi:MAG TPA: hypothetical protein VNL38_03220 [Candidatus Nitrosotenuis sp.]|nr:hypothetical protein [Candidatus Nitrosotenuis sp.]